MRTGPGSPLRSALVRVAVLGLLVATAVGLRAGSPTHADGSSWQVDDLLHRGATGLQVLIVLWVVVVLVLVVVNGRGVDGRSRRQGRRSSLFSLLVLVAFVAAAWVVNQQLHRTATPSTRVLTPTPSPGPSATTTATDHHATGNAGLAALGLLVLVAVLTAVFTARRRRTEPLGLEEATDAMAHGLAAAARVLRERVHEGPREAVVAAERALEQLLASR